MQRATSGGSVFLLSASLFRPLALPEEAVAGLQPERLAEAMSAGVAIDSATQLKLAPQRPGHVHRDLGGLSAQTSGFRGVLGPFGGSSATEERGARLHQPMFVLLALPGPGMSVDLLCAQVR